MYINIMNGNQYKQYFTPGGGGVCLWINGILIYYKKYQKELYEILKVGS